MKNSLSKDGEMSNIDIYKSKISEIDCLQEYVNDTEIFNSDSDKFRDFLATSFSHLHPDFHYLSFLKSEERDAELMKAAEVFQILKTTTKKGGKLLENFNSNEIHEFWMKFFSLFTKNKKNASNEQCFLDTKSQYQYFSELQDAQNYLNYDFPLINMKKIKSVDVNEEIGKWNAVQHPDVNLSLNELSIEIGKSVNEVNTDKLIIDLKHIATTYNKFDRTHYKHASLGDNFFLNFNNSVENIFKYKKVNGVGSLISENEYLQNESTNEHWDNLYFLKNFSNINSLLQCKIQKLF